GDDEICPYATFHLLGFREEVDPAQAANNFQTFPHQNGHGSGGPFPNSNSRSMPRHGSGNYYSCVSGDYACGHSSHEGAGTESNHQPRHGSGNYLFLRQWRIWTWRNLAASMMSNSTFSPTYDDPARSDEESDQYGGSTYSGGGPYARAIDSVSQSGTAKRANSIRNSSHGGQGSPEPPPPPPPRTCDMPESSLNDSNNSTSSNQYSEAECDHDLVQRNYGVKTMKNTEEMRKLLDKNEATTRLQNGGLKMLNSEMKV
ncbi:hypothetical protein Anas_07291, partial [Armadillidium nasatum]